MQVVEITDPDELEALRPEWRALVEACPHASPFQSPEWLLAWREAFLRSGLWALAVRDGARLVGLAPLYIHVAEDGARQLTLLGNGLSDRLDLIAAPGPAAGVATALFEQLTRRRELWDVCDFRDLPAGSPVLAAAVADVAEDVVEPEPPCPTLDLSDAGAVPPKRRRQDLDRCARRLAEQGRAVCRTADAGSLADDLGHLMRLHAARWARRGEPGVLADAAVKDFHERASAALLAGGGLRLDLLELDGRPIAAHYGFRRGGRGYSYIHGYDPAFAACAPSRLLLAHVIAEARRDGLAEFDFLRGAEPYKYEWGARDRPQFRRRILQ
jgi:CelD/BcsL family acetyltransferase involved in cellulose biosynthesis